MNIECTYPDCDEYEPLVVESRSDSLSNDDEGSEEELRHG